MTRNSILYTCSHRIAAANSAINSGIYKIDTGQQSIAIAFVNCMNLVIADE